MNFFTKLDLGKKALAFGGAVRDIATNVDPDAVLAVLGKIIQLQADPQYQGSGSGVRKARALVLWFGQTYPTYQRYTGAVETLATVVVVFFKAVKAFR